MAAPADVGRTLLVQCLEAPDDEAPKLVYADWLEEQGSPIATLIRKQVAGDDVEALVAEHREDWVGPIERWSRSPHFERGMIRFLQIAAGDYAKKATQATLVAMLSKFGNLTTMLRGQSARLAECASLAWSTELWWWDCQLDDARMADLASSAHLGHLRSLVLEKVRCRNAGLAALARSRRLPRLRRFGLPAPVHLGSYDTSAVIDVLAAHPITELIVTGVNKLSPDELGNAPAAARLERLEITTTRVAELTRTAHLTALAHLRLDTFSPVPDAAFEPLLDTRVFGKLTSLDLSIARGLGDDLLARFRERFGAGLTYRATAV